tara:strand:- start:2310 stop:3035 length:726 start_codon:yes stop_codon:yes gene_type:complete
MKLVEMLKSELPEYSTKISSSDLNMCFRPFLVKEEKTLLLISEDGTFVEIIRTIKNILESCYTDLDVSKITLAEAEYLFIKLREKSIGEELDLLYRQEGKNPVTLQVDLRKVKAPSLPKRRSNNISLTAKINVTMRDLSMSDVLLNEINVYEASQEEIIKSLACMIDTVTIEEESLSGNDLSMKDKLEFIENMTEQQFTKLVKFSEKAPVLSYTFKEMIHEEEKEFTLTGLNDFFGLVSPT